MSKAGFCSLHRHNEKQDDPGWHFQVCITIQDYTIIHLTYELLRGAEMRRPKKGMRSSQAACFLKNTKILSEKAIQLREPENSEFSERLIVFYKPHRSLLTVVRNNFPLWGFLRIFNEWYPWFLFMTKTTYLVGSKGTLLSLGKKSKCSHISFMGKTQLSFAKTFCCCQQVLVNFVEVSGDFSEVLFSLVSATCQGVMGSCGCWGTWAGHCHDLLPGLQEQDVFVWDDQREGLVCCLDPVLKCRALPDAANPAVCTSISLFQFPIFLPPTSSALISSTTLI